MTKFAKICALLLFVPVVVLSVQILRLSYITTFPKVEIAVNGFDPKDLFSGYYMQLELDWQRTKCSQFVDNTCPINNFEKTYAFYISEENSYKLSTAVNNHKAVLEFSYKEGFKPLVTDLKVDGISYKKFITEKTK